MLPYKHCMISTRTRIEGARLRLVNMHTLKCNSFELSDIFRFIVNELFTFRSFANISKCSAAVFNFQICAASDEEAVNFDRAILN